MIVVTVVLGIIFFGAMLFVGLGGGGSSSRSTGGNRWSHGLSGGSYSGSCGGGGGTGGGHSHGGGHSGCGGGE